MAGALAQMSNEPQQPVLDAQSAIASLLTKRANYAAQQDPAAQDQERKSALSQYQEALKANPAGSYTPNDVSLATTVGNFGRMTPFAALGAGAMAGSNFGQQVEAAKFKNNVTAAHAGYQDITNEGKGDIQELSALKGLLGAKGLSGKQPSPEKLAEVYKTAFNTAAQTAKDQDFKFSNAEERMAWIRQEANTSVQNYVDNYALQPTGPRGNQPPVTGMPPVSAPVAGMPPVSGAESAPAVAGITTTPEENAPRNAAAIIKELARPEYKTPKYADAKLALEQELKLVQAGQTPLYNTPPRQPQTVEVPGSEAVKQPVAAATIQPNKPIGQPTATQQPVVAGMRNRPQEAGAIQGAKDMAGAHVEDYKTITAEAAAAESQKAAFDTLQKIKPNTGMFANTEQTLGSLFSALGADPNDPIIQSAMKTRNAEQILSYLTNSSLKAEKGVQTKTDEVRIYKEFPKTSDFQKVWDFSIKLGKEKAQRKLDQRDYFDKVAADNNGTPIAARQKWDKEMANDPITQYLGGQLIFRSDFVNAYARKHPNLGVSGGVAKWREMEQDYQKRGGTK